MEKETTMSVQVYWQYYYKNSELVDVIAQSPEEAQHIYGLWEQSNVSVSGLSKFDFNIYHKIYQQILTVLATRCYRFNQVYATCNFEEFSLATLVVRKWMLNITLPSEVKEIIDSLVAQYGSNKWELLNNLIYFKQANFKYSQEPNDVLFYSMLDDYKIKDFKYYDDFEVMIAWDIYCYQNIFQKLFGASIFIIEDKLSSSHWEKVNQRSESSQAIEIEQIGCQLFEAKGTSSKYLVDLQTMECNCGDFINRGRKNGIHCKHLIAALKKDELWNLYWEKFIPNQNSPKKIRITGIVKTANEVKNNLQPGIHTEKIASLKKFVDNSLLTIENICKEANTIPDSLPTPSRNAYYYLKGIDWHNLPSTEQQQTTKSFPTLRLRNVIKQQKNIQQQIAKLNSHNSSTKIESIAKALTNCTQKIEHICDQNNVTPAVLTTPSRKAYAWMKFLSDSNNLQLHIKAIERIKTIANKAITKQTLTTQQLDTKEITVEITNCNDLYKSKKNRQGVIELQLSEGFILAEDNIFQAIINLIFLGNNPHDKQLIRNFGLSEEYSDVTLELDLIADLDAEAPQGSCYDLEQMFCFLNQKYFAGKMVKPRLTWNQNLTHRKLGHYEASRDRIVMSRTLDDSNVPKIVVELVLYHEMLHKYHGIKWVNGKRMVHTREFRLSEQKFKYYQEAQQWLKQSFTLPV